MPDLFPYKIKCNSKNIQLTKAAFVLNTLVRSLNNSSSANKNDTIKNYLPAAITGAGTATAYKLYDDVNSIFGRLNNWEEAMGKHRDSMDFKHGLQQRIIDRINTRISDPDARAKAIERLKGRHLYKGEHYVNTGRASKIIDDYITHAKGLAQSKILGLPAGNIMQFMVRHDPGAVKHYELFTNPALSSVENLRHHMIEKALSYRDKGSYFFNGLKDGQLIFNPEMKKLIKEPGSVAKRLQNFSKAFPNTFANEILRNAITGVPSSSSLDNIGEGLRLAGNNSTVFSTPEVYIKNIKNTINPLLKLRLPILSAGALATGSLLASPYFKKNASVSKKADISRPEDAFFGSASVGISPFLFSQALKNFSPNKNIGITYGEMGGPYGLPDIGGGHRGPSKALKSILEEAVTDPKSPLFGYNLDEIVRNKAGIIQAGPRNYNTILDTGLGLFTDSPFWEGQQRTHRVDAPTGIKTQSRMHLLTDAIASDRLRRGGATEIPFPRGVFKNHFIGYGDNFDTGAKIMGYKGGWLGALMPKQFSRVSEGLTPAVNKDVLDIIRTPQTREAVLSGMASSYEKTNPELASKIKNILSSGNKLITISGSGRGDYVAARARELIDALRSNNIKDVSVAAQLAGAFDDPKQMQLLKDYPELLTFGKMPLKDFVNLQRVSNLHMGSSGTSSLAESLLQGTPFVLPKDWGWRTWYHSGGGKHITENTPAALHAKLMEMYGHDPHHAQTAVTTWNRGNMQYAKKLPGVFTAESAEDVIKLIKDPKLLESYTQGAKQRAGMEFEKLMKGRKNLVSTVASEVARNNALRRLKGLGLLGLGGTALTGGISKLFSKEDKVK